MSKKKILIVDDEKSFVRILISILTSVGYDTFITKEGKNILDVTRNIMPDLILLDVILPDTSGFEAKAQLNEDSLTVDIPVIFLTVKNETPDKVKGFSLGAHDYIIKPFNSEELLARIDSILNRKSFYEKIAMTDGLTGLYNVNFFQRQLRIFFDEAKRYKKIFSVAAIDVNGMKRINDTQGHVAGDFILKEFAKIAKDTFRKSDVIIRYGGDEFVIIMPETKGKQAKEAVERFKSNISGRTFAFRRDKKPLSFSVSAGIASYNDKFKDNSEIFELADQRLYKDKGS
ncbi:MAG: diguanylate cyclase [Candidatus Omnitrophica bacterium]|nr:diguanylate cyclase [Candidatus Omnitrophota bacterium]